MTEADLRLWVRALISEGRTPMQVLSRAEERNYLDGSPMTLEAVRTLVRRELHGGTGTVSREPKDDQAPEPDVARVAAFWATVLDARMRDGEYNENLLTFLRVLRPPEVPEAEVPRIADFVWAEYTPPDAEDEIRRIESGEWQRPELPGGRYKFALHSVSDIIAWPPPTWLVPGFIVADALNVFFGPAGCYKTFMASDLALSIALDLPWHGRTVQPGVVVYVAAEGVAGLGKRVRVWLAKRGIAPSKAEGFRVVSVPLSPFTPGDVDAFIADVTAQIGEGPKPILAVFDTLSRTFAGGDESSTRDMTIYVAAIDKIRRAFGAAALILHHVGWNAEHERGNTALRCASDLMLSMQKASEASEGDLGTATVTYVKVKDWEPPKPQVVTLAEVAVEPDTKSLVVVDVREASAGETRTDRDAEARRARILECLGSARDALTLDALRRIVGGRKETLKSDLAHLVAGGFAKTASKEWNGRGTCAWTI